MARSFDIASFDPSDGILNEQLRRKLNGNFSRLCAMIGTESPTVVKGDLTDSLRGWATQFVAQYVDGRVDQVVGQAVDRALDEAYPVGSVVVTTTASDPRLSRGRWQQVGSGRYVRAAGDGVPVMAEGGGNLIEASMLPDHTHDVPVRSGEADPGGQVPSLLLDAAGGAPNETYGVTGLPAEQEPFEPSYIALLFYRRTQ